MTTLRSLANAEPRATESQRRLPVLFIVLLALVSLILSACAVDISTTQKMDAKGKGTRVMTAVADLSDDDIPKFDAKKIETVLKKAAPEGTAVDSVTKKGDKLTIKVTMSFDDVESYKKVMGNALKAGGLEPGDLQVDFQVSKGEGLRQGVVLKENVKSSELLEWMRVALVKDKILSEEDGDDISIHGNNATLTIDGKKFEDIYTPFDREDVTDNGFYRIEPKIEKKAEGYRLAVTYDLASDSEEKDAQVKWIDSVMPEGAKKLEATDPESYDETVATVVMDVKDEKALNAALAKLLADEKATFSVDVSDVEDEPLKHKIVYTLKADCSAVCNDGDKNVVRSFAALPGGAEGSHDFAEEDLKAWGFTQDANFVRLSSDENERVYRAEEVKTMKLASFDVTLKPSMGDKVSLEVELGFPMSEVGEGAEKVEKGLKPSDGSISSEKKDDLQVFTMSWDGENAEELAKKVRKTFPSFELGTYREAGLWPETRVGLSFYPLDDLDTALDDEPKLKVDLPFLHSMKTVQPEDGFPLGQDIVGIEYSGPVLAWYITMGAVLGLIILAVGLLVVFRKKIAAKFKASQEKKKQERAEQANAYSGVRAEYAQTMRQFGPPVPPAADAGLPAPLPSDPPPAPSAPPVPPAGNTAPMPPAGDTGPAAPPPPAPQPGDDAAPPAPPQQ